MKRRHNLLVLLFFYATYLVSAQKPQTLKGIVLEQNSKGIIEPIQGAMVHWVATSIGTSTDSNGVFYILTHSTSRALVIQATGYKSDTITVSAKNFVKVMLVNKSNLSEVTINYERKSTEVRFLDPWKTTIMNEKELFKSACCNLSESFETNPSVDVSYADALTGTKQIQLLGLATQYTQLTQEALPSTRGLASVYGFSYTPGTWINSIQLSKGVGSVVNGYESIAGQINVELHKPDAKEKVYVNAYASEGGRYELNAIVNNTVSNTFSQSILVHTSTYKLRMDRNGDGYLDNPLGTQVNGMYRFAFNNQKGFVLLGGFRLLGDKKIGGQITFSENMFDTANQQAYGTRVKAERAEGWLKTGYVFPQKKYKSIGLQLKAEQQRYDNFFGNNTYFGLQQSGYVNLIYQSIIGTTDHKFRTGMSSQIDQFDEQFVNQANNYLFNRNEWVTGAFGEYTYSYLATFTLVAGFRSDYNNLFGWQHTPRMHARYALTEKTVFRASAGKGWRTPNLLAENSGMMLSSRKWNFNTMIPLASGALHSNVWNIKPELAWNYGLNLTQDFKLNYRPGTFSVDYYYTHFLSQVVVDRDANAQEINIYQLNGNSYSNSIQFQLDYQLIRRLDVRLAYRWFDVQQQYKQGLLQQPMVAKHRAFANMEYKTKNKWNFDATLQWTGAKRLPSTINNPSDKQLPPYSPTFFILNTQVSKSLKYNIDVYGGVENLFNFKQLQPIIDGNNPYGTYFDASMVWGPVFGRMLYAGIRWKY